MEWQPSTPINVGDRFTVTLPAYRRWWQFWKPRSWLETRTYRCTAASPSQD